MGLLINPYRFAAAGGGGAAPAVLQHATVRAETSGQTTSLTGVLASSVVMVMICTYGDPTVNTVTGTGTWTKVVAENNATVNKALEIWVCSDHGGGTVSVASTSTAVAVAHCMVEVANVNPAAVATNTINGTTGVAGKTPTLAVTAGQFVFGGWEKGTSGSGGQTPTGLSYTPETWTLLTWITFRSSTFCRLVPAYLVPTVSGTAQVLSTAPTADVWSGVIAAFNAA